MNTWKVILMGGLSGLALANPVWSAEAGRVQFVQGTVQASDAAGRERALQKGDAVNEGDTLLTAAGASAQLRMADGGYIAVRPDTRMKIDSFRFGKAEERESSILSLFKGGFRAITGLIGRVRKEDYRITTPAATIGIRGTDHETVVVSPDSSLASAGVPAGTYNKVNAGETIITTDKGTLNVLPNQMGYAGGMSQMPKQLPVNANLFAAAPPPPASAKVQEGGQEGEAPRETAVVDNTSQQQAASTDTATAGTTAGGSTNTLPPPPQQTITTTSGATLSGAGAGGATGFPAFGQGSIAYFNTNLPGALGYVLSDTVNYKNDTAGLLSGFSTTGGYVALRNGATVVDSGSVMLSATESIGWGRWSGAGATLAQPNSVAMPVYNLHYVGGPQVTQMPATGTFRYVYVGGTLPTDSAGATGTVTSASLTVTFGAAPVVQFGVGVSFAGAMFNASGSGGVSANGIIPVGAMGVTCTGACPVGAAGPTGSFSGSLVGTGATGAGITYFIARTPAAMTAGRQSDIAGAVAFRR